MEAENFDDLTARKMKLLIDSRKPTYQYRKAYLKPFSKGYIPPTSSEVREEFSDFTGSEISTMLGVDARTIRRWIQDENDSGYRAIPYPAWRLFLILTGKVPAE
jgi:hypothetical protein